MAALYLIRHGQASFGKANYDQLSELGYKQSELLAQHWQPFTKPCKVYTGELARHKQTSKALLQQYQTQSTTLASLNEFDHHEIISKAQLTVDSPTDLAALNKQFMQALSNWISAADKSEYKESWAQFKQRCLDALFSIIGHKQSEQHILAFTSGGVIAAIVQHVLTLSDSQSFDILTQQRNTSITKLLFTTTDTGDTKITLDYFNNFQHLEQSDRNWITYR